MQKMRFLPLALMGLLAYCAVSCDTTPEVPVDTDTYEGTFNIQPNSFPAGGGVDLNAADSGQVAQLDSATSFPWDIKMITYRTSQGGRPGIFLYGDSATTGSVRAVDVSALSGIATGLTGFNAFTEVSVAMQDAATTDGVFDFDPAVDVDDQGNPDGTKLAAAYAKLVIGDQINNLATDDQPVFLMISREGLYYKVQMISRENGGDVAFRWARFADDAIME